MLTLEERALATDIADRLIELYIDREEARRAEDWDRMRDLQATIEETTTGQRSFALRGGANARQRTTAGTAQRVVGDGADVR
jgi:hypothetical protein